jgi:protein Tex
VVKAGDIVKVRVKEVEAVRKRIALTMKSGAIDTSQPSISAGGGPGRPASGPVTSQRAFSPPPSKNEGESALAAALRRAREGK